MFLLQVTHLNGQVKFEQLFATYKDAAVAGFEFQKDRPDATYTIVYTGGNDAGLH